MNLRMLGIFVFVFSMFISCGVLKPGLSPSEILKRAGVDVMPTAADFPDDGAVILYEDELVNFHLDGALDLEIERTYHLALLYFNDKAEGWLTHSIYLGPKRILKNFFARFQHRILRCPAFRFNYNRQ